MASSSRPPRTPPRRRLFRHLLWIILILPILAIAAALLIPCTWWVRGTGYITTDMEVELRSSVTGTISQILFDSGQTVEKNQCVIQLNNTIQKATLAQASSDLQAKQAKLDQTRSRQSLQQAQRQQQRLQAQQSLTLDQSRLDRMIIAVQHGGGFSKQELEDTRLKVQIAQSRLDELSLPYDHVEADQIKVLQEQIASAHKKVALHQAQLDTRKICSPLKGTIYLNRLEVGEVIKPEHILGQIFSTNQWIMKIRIPERYIGHIKTGQAIKLETAAYSHWRHGYLNATVHRIIPIINTQATGDGLFEAQAMINAATYPLQPGMSATAWVNVGQATWFEQWFD